MSAYPLFSSCPRCGECAMEHLKDYSHCVNCFHFRDYYQEDQYDIALLEEQLLKAQKKREPVRHRALHLVQGQASECLATTRMQGSRVG